MSDLIRREDVIEVLMETIAPTTLTLNTLVMRINSLPSAETHDKRTETHGVCSDLIRRQDAITIPVMPKEHRQYQTMNIDDAYERGWYDLQDCIESLPSAEPKTGWIPCSKMLPKAEDMYQPPEQRYLCQLEAYGERKFCVLSRLKGAVSPFWDWYGVAVHDHEVIAWMPLPEPYKGGDDE